MTYLTLNQINSNPLYAPLGEEATFKRRIFLDNVSRCMTIREFQKTAGIEIKKKLTETPSAKALRLTIESFHKNYKYFSLNNFGNFYFTVSQNKEENILKTCAKYYTTKKGKVVKTRKERVKELVYNWVNHNRFYYRNGNRNEDNDALFRVGFYRIMDSFEKEISKGDILQSHTYWELSDYPMNWVNKNKNFYYSPFWNEPQIRARYN